MKIVCSQAEREEGESFLWKIVKYILKQKISVLYDGKGIVYYFLNFFC